jgi:hypothetical protein
MRRLLAATAIVAALAACTTTTQEKVQMGAQTQGFMGDAYPLLSRGRKAR